MLAAGHFPSKIFQTLSVNDGFMVVPAILWDNVLQTMLPSLFILFYFINHRTVTHFIGHQMSFLSFVHFLFFFFVLLFRFFVRCYYISVSVRYFSSHFIEWRKFFSNNFTIERQALIKQSTGQTTRNVA